MQIPGVHVGTGSYINRQVFSQVWYPFSHQASAKPLRHCFLSYNSCVDGHGSRTHLRSKLNKYSIHFPCSDEYGTIDWDLSGPLIPVQTMPRSRHFDKRPFINFIAAKAFLSMTPQYPHLPPPSVKFQSI